MWVTFMTAITTSRRDSRAVSFDMAYNQTGSAENKITERSSLYNNLLTFVGEKGASIKTVTSSNNDPPGQSQAEAPDLFLTSRCLVLLFGSTITIDQIQKELLE